MSHESLARDSSRTQDEAGASSGAGANQVEGHPEDRAAGHAKSSTESPAEHEQPRRQLRADAQRNIDTLLGAAAEVFAESGVDAPVRQITARAGVGAGTLYRHFPQRSDLIAAVFRHEVDACADAAPELAARYEPDEALVRWLRRFSGFVGTKRGLSTALHSGDPAYDNLHNYFQQRFRPVLGGLLEAAAAAGRIRDGVQPDELLFAVASLSHPVEDDEHYVQRMIGLLVDGLRYGATRPPA